MQDSRGLIVVVVLLVMILTIGPCNKTPDPPVPPPPVNGLAASVQQLAARLVPAADRAKSASVASEYRRLAAEIQTLPQPLSQSKLLTPAAAIAASNQAARAALGNSWDAWQPFYRELFALLNAAEQRPDADRTVYGVGKSFAAIAAGLQ